MEFLFVAEDDGAPGPSRYRCALDDAELEALARDGADVGEGVLKAALERAASGESDAGNDRR